MEPPVMVFVMEEVKVCRICLNVNVKMYKLEGILLENYYKHVLAGLYIKNILELFQYACYECVYYIQKYSAFREKCIQGLSVLLQIYEQNGTVTENELKAIDRLNLGLCSNLVINVPIGFNIGYETEHVAVKEEPSTNNIYDIDESTNNIYDIDDIGVFLKCNDIKAETDPKEDDEASISEATDDELCTEEPISEGKVFRRIKRKKLVVKRLQSAKKSKDNCQKSNESLLNRCTKKTIENYKHVTDNGMKQPKKKKITKNERDVADLEIKQRKGKKTIRNDENVTDLQMKQPEGKGPERHPSGYTPEEINMKDDMTVVKLSIEEQLAEVTKRQNSSNYLKSVYKCASCYKGFADPVAYDNHMKRHDSSNGSFKCPICKLCFPTRTIFKKHVPLHEKNYICKICSCVCKSLSQAKQHRNEHKGKVYNCEQCGNVSMKWTSHLTHIRIKHPSDFVCDICGFSFVSKLGLTLHRTKIHKNVTESQTCNVSKQIPYCKVCNVQSNSFQTWRKHIASIAHKIKENIDFNCVVCGEILKSVDQLRLHHRRFHPQRRYDRKTTLPLVFPKKCQHCDVQICNAQKYAGHFRRAHPDKQYPITKDHICDICGKRYTGKTFLHYHRRTHFADRAYKCSQCPKAFINRFNLTVHEKIHSDDRPHACNSCSKAFRTSGALSRHMLCHTGEKPYECNICGKTFSQSNSRNLHVKTVHLKQPTPYVSRNRLKKRRPAQAAPSAEHSDNSIY